MSGGGTKSLASVSTSTSCSPRSSEPHGAASPPAASSCSSGPTAPSDSVSLDSMSCCLRSCSSAAFWRNSSRRFCRSAFSSAVLDATAFSFEPRRLDEELLPLLLPPPPVLLFLFLLLLPPLVLLRLRSGSFSRLDFFLPSSGVSYSVRVISVSELHASTDS